MLREALSPLILICLVLQAFIESVFESKRAIVEATDKLTVYPVASSRMAAYLITVTPEDNFADPR